MVEAFWKSRRGNIMMVFALSASAIVLLIGLSLDARRMMSVRAELQHAVDAAALAAAVALREGGAGQVMSDGKNAPSYVRRGRVAFDSNLSQNSWRSAPQVEFEAEGKTVHVSASGYSNTLFLDAVSDNAARLSASASATSDSGPPVCVFALRPTD